MLLRPLEAFGSNSIDIGVLLERCNAAYAKVNDYTCMLHRKDLVNGALKEHTTVLFKYKKPSRYYMKWEQDKIEAIYAEGKYNNKMVIHGGLLLKFVSVAVKPDAALKYNRHTIKDADIGHILNMLGDNYRRAKDDKDASIVLEEEGKLDTRPTWRFKAVFPGNRNYYGHRVFVDIDRELFLPIRIEVYGWQGELLELYYYEDLKLNVGLVEDDFDVSNKKYLFKMGY
jgi:hypothetical protein